MRNKGRALEPEVRPAKTAGDGVRRERRMPRRRPAPRCASRRCARQRSRQCSRRETRWSRRPPRREGPKEGRGGSYDCQLLCGVRGAAAEDTEAEAAALGPADDAREPRREPKLRACAAQGRRWGVVCRGESSGRNSEQLSGRQEMVLKK